MQIKERTKLPFLALHTPNINSNLETIKYAYKSQSLGKLNGVLNQRKTLRRQRKNTHYPGPHSGFMGVPKRKELVGLL